MSIPSEVSNSIGRTSSLWVALFVNIILFIPSTFKQVGPYVPWLLGIVMLGMGLTLKPSDFDILFKRSKVVIIDVTAQFAIMPVTTYLLAKLLDLPVETAVGAILAGCYPGGTASNVVTYLAHDSMALSVAVTPVSTLISPLLALTIFLVLVDEMLEIRADSMLTPIAKMVLFPIVLGLIVHKALSSKTEKLTDTLPLVSVTAIVLIIGTVVGVSKGETIKSDLLIFAAAILHNGISYLFGFFTAEWTGLPYDTQGTPAIRVGTQNSGLGVVLTAAHFATASVVAVPSTLLSAWHNISGSFLVAYQAAKAGKNKES